MTNFKEIVGHDDIISHLRNAIKMNRVSHAYIIEGEEGIGKKLLANVFAKTLQCEAKGDEPCDVCTSCLNFESGNHPDINYVIPTKKASIGVDDIREQLNMDIYVKPYQYPYKIYIVQDADTMTVQAQNALLKTIEEPPYYAIILLIAGNSSMFLPTVLSRCVILSLKQIEESKIEKYLAQHDHISPEQAKIFASFSRGNIGKAKMLLASEVFESIRNDVIKTIDCVIENNDFELMEMVKKLCEDKDRGAMILDFMLTWLRDLMLIKKIP
ncbi:MAG: DNA polymerase III subunit delta', partial [Vallitaleaceae bacterium]|nr:DNA polymerase III subunit delta' [Vallitaleaceae bacterium]